MNPKQFLLIGGTILVGLGILGMFLLGPTPEQSLLKEGFFLTDFENYAHLMIGIVALGAYFLLADSELTKWLVILVGLVSLVASIAGFLNSGNPIPNLGFTNLENPLDNILHLLLAVWAFYAGFVGGREKESV